MRTELDAVDDVKEFAQIVVPTIQKPLYERDGWEFVETVDFRNCSIRKRISPPESPP